MTQDISARTTHDLWVESRKMTLDISRPTPTTIQLDITYPTDVEVLDGAVVTLGTKPISGSNYPTLDFLTACLSQTIAEWKCYVVEDVHRVKKSRKLKQNSHTAHCLLALTRRNITRKLKTIKVYMAALGSQ